MKKLQKLFAATLILAVSALGLAMMPLAVNAQPAAEICEGIGAVSGEDGCTEPADETSLNDVIAAVINILSIVVGVVSVIMIIVGGVKYTTSAGDASSTNVAKNTILYALIGLVIAAIAQFVVRFVISKV